MSAHHNPKLKLGENESVRTVATDPMTTQFFASASLACRCLSKGTSPRINEKELIRKELFMSSVDKAIESQLKNIQTRTGKTLEQLYAHIKKSGLAKHGEIRDMLKKDLALGHGDANTLVHTYLKAGTGGSAAPSSTDAVLDQIYAGPKADLRPIHEKLMTAINKFGEFEIAPKKGYVSLRRKKQFAMIGPATNTRVEVGLNMKGVKGTDRLNELPAGQMCQYKVKVTDAKEVNKELVDWLRQAYDSAG